MPQWRGQIPQNIHFRNMQNTKTCILSKLTHDFQQLLYNDKNYQILFVGGTKTCTTNPRWWTAVIWRPGVCIAGYRVAICFTFIFLSFFLKNFCQPNYLDFHLTDFHAVFTVRFYYDCRWTIWTSIFEFSRDVAMSTSFLFLCIFVFFAVTPKRREIGIWSR